MNSSGKSVGVVIGRFQVSNLHAGHLYLINYAASQSDELLVIIGSGHSLATPRYPLPYQVRAAMVKSVYPNAIVAEHFDDPSDKRWSARLDEIILSHFAGFEVTLFGSRDSFIPRYHGRFATKEIPSLESESGSDQRRNIILNPPQTTDFRAGLIYREQTRLPISYQAVDIAIFKAGGQQILLGQKATDGDFWRLPGGFVDPALDRSLEAAAKREAREETGDIELADVHYRGSVIIDDWRYRNQNDQVMTALFSATYIFGRVAAGDDLANVRWFNLDEARAVISPTHLPLLNLLPSSV